MDATSGPIWTKERYSLYLMTLFHVIPVPVPVPGSCIPAFTGTPSHSYYVLELDHNYVFANHMALAVADE